MAQTNVLHQHITLLQTKHEILGLLVAFKIKNNYID